LASHRVVHQTGWYELEISVSLWDKDTQPRWNARLGARTGKYMHGEERVNIFAHFPEIKGQITKNHVTLIVMWLIINRVTGIYAKDVEKMIKELHVLSGL
jgi:hypothetical protein